ncbi:hypothetical protein T08_13519 [Trichinella sp. T8]|nr:hypothetical protein T08_13519 [Trichinella sp. T8]
MIACSTIAQELHKQLGRRHWSRKFLVLIRNLNILLFGALINVGYIVTDTVSLTVKKKPRSKKEDIYPRSWRLVGVCDYVKTRDMPRMNDRQKSTVTTDVTVFDLFVP